MRWTPPAVMCATSLRAQLGVDVEHGYEPKYITIRGKGDMLGEVCGKKLKKQIRFISQLTRTVRERRFPGI